MREELDKLRKEFESVRDAYGARLAALEAKLDSIEGEPPPAPRRRRPRRRPAPPPSRRPGADRRASRCRRARRASGGPPGALPVYGNASAMSKIFNPDIAVIGNFLGAAGKNSINPTPALG